jgi:hypothetical protein
MIPELVILFATTYLGEVEYVLQNAWLLYLLMRFNLNIGARV